MDIINRLITHLKPKAPISEAYRMLRTNIQFSSFNGEIKTIAVTSSEPSEGKSTIISNLAVTMAKSGKKVLLIDCDLRKPNIHKIFGINNRIGFVNALIENLEEDRVIKKINELEGLSIITSGTIPPNPSEILSSPKVKTFIKKLEESFDIILIDTTPVRVVADAAIVSTYVDGVIIVVSYGETYIEGLKETKTLLDNVNAHLIGTVLNKVPLSERKYSRGYYYGDE